MLGVYLALAAVTLVLFKAVPSGFVPAQDKAVPHRLRPSCPMAPRWTAPKKSFAA